MRKLLLTFLLFFFFTPIIKALEPNYQVTGLYINADIKENGDLLVEEQIVLEGSFNGYIRDLSYRGVYSLYDASSLKILGVYQVTKETKGKFKEEKQILGEFKKANVGFNGDSYIYVHSFQSGLQSLKMFRYTPGGTVVFGIEYLLKDVVLLHEDIAELYWTFIGENFDDNIKEVIIKINLPKESKELRGWAHGPLHGEIKLNGKQQIVAEIKDLKAHELIDIRTVFDLEVVPFGGKFSSQKDLDNILVEESNRAEEANALRKRSKIIHYSLVFFNYFWLVGLITLVVYIYQKYDKEYRSSFNLEYYRDFPGEYGPEVLEYLLKKGITTNSVSASILSIIQKKGLIIEETLNKKDYILRLSKEKETLTKEEEYLRNWLITDYGNGEEVHLKEIRNASKKMKTAEEFIRKYDSWVHLVKSKSIKEEFFEDHFAIKIKLFFYFLLGVILFVINHSLDYISLIVIINLVLAILFLIYIINFNKRSKKGQDHFVKWQAFKKFLLDFGRFQEKELPEIILWEKYLVYATIFGIANKVRKVMNIKLKTMETSATTYPVFTHFYINEAFSNSLNRTINSTRQMSHNKIAQTTSSSSGGFGGGFSGGGGFGGGGTSGGGRGF
ncbi:MAG: DUF2207 family protein [Bacilli bacterium]|jgi:uncharacterized membrane protein